MNFHPQSLLAIFAHPDDETVCSGTLARYAREGTRVVLVCATRGENGQISDPALATRETLPRVREGEMRCAADALGAAEVVFLDYHDSGMAGTEENKQPSAFINADAREVVEIVRAERPDVVMTFDPTGGYGHPDHIAINRHTVAAFHAAADSARYRDLGDIWQTQRLIYPVFPRRFLLDLREEFVERSLDTSELDQFIEMGAGFPMEQVDFEVDISATIDAKWQALKCHRTQFGPDSIFFKLPDDMTKSMMTREYFALSVDAAGRH